MNTLSIAVRAARRTMARLDAQYEKAYAMASAYDGGEWSGPAIGRSQDAANAQVVQLVADHYGCQTDSVWSMIGQQESQEMHNGM